MECSICYRNDAKSFPVNRFHGIECLCCGKYAITTEAQADIEWFLKDNRYLLSGVTRESTLKKPFKLITITTQNIEDLVITYSPVDVAEKIDRLLLNFSRLSKFPGHNIKIDVDNAYPLAYAANKREYGYYDRHLRESDFLDKDTQSDRVLLTVKGWNRVHELSVPRVDSEKVFVAMNFDSEYKSIYEDGIAPAIVSTGYKPYRIDFEQHVDKIDDKILAEIKESRFMIADFSGQKHGVYFESGFALGLNIPVIWTCEKGETKQLHFDTRQYNHIFWETSEDLKAQLVDRIRFLIGKKS